jgi:IPT/TIG domain
MQFAVEQAAAGVWEWDGWDADGYAKPAFTQVHRFSGSDIPPDMMVRSFIDQSPLFPVYSINVAGSGWKFALRLATEPFSGGINSHPAALIPMMADRMHRALSADFDWSTVGDGSRPFVSPVAEANPVVEVILRLGHLPPGFVVSLEPNSGQQAGGDLVMIRGREFAPGETTVTFWNEPATDVTVTDRETLTCLTPPSPYGPGQASVVVSTPGGSTYPTQFTYL